MAEQVIEATWEDLIRREDLRGRRLRVTVIDDNGAHSPQLHSPRAGDDPWVARLREWAARQPAPSHFVDDSRDAIYGGTVDDPR